MCTADASAAHRPCSPIFPVVDFRGEKGLWTRDWGGGGGGGVSAVAQRAGRAITSGVQAAMAKLRDGSCD